MVIAAGTAGAAFVGIVLGVGMLREAAPGTRGRRWGVALTALGATAILMCAVVWAVWIVFDLAG